MGRELPELQSGRAVAALRRLVHAVRPTVVAALRRSGKSARVAALTLWRGVGGVIQRAASILRRLREDLRPAAAKLRRQLGGALQFAGAVFQRLGRAVYQGDAAPTGKAEAVPSAAGRERWEPLVVDVTAGLWRVQAKMADQSRGFTAEEARHLYWHVQAMWDVLADAGVSARDYDGMVYDPGLPVSVAAFQPMARMRREEVVETLRPSVYVDGRLVCLGEVVVGTPALVPEPHLAEGEGLDDAGHD